jgi:hypothetical protein
MVKRNMKKKLKISSLRKNVQRVYKRTIYWRLQSFVIIQLRSFFSFCLEISLKWFDLTLYWMII